VRILIPLLLLASLTACTPPHEPLVALAVRDGRPTGVLVTCGGRFSQLSVYRNYDSDRESFTRPHVSWRISGTPATEIVEVDLLGEAPAGWEVADVAASSAGPATDVALTALEPGLRYSVSGSSGRKALPVGFSLADASKLGPDEVLTANGDWETVAMSRDEFLREARASCP
jgi:hypothetical protein